MELRQLEYFVTVAETLHFGRAAELLHIAQPAVSQQIRRLERDLGAELLDRSPRHVRLTAAGLRFLPEARAVLAAADRARTVAKGSAHPAIRLGTSTGLGDHLDAVLSRLAGLWIELTALPVRERSAQVAEGRLDAAFVRGNAERPGLAAIEVWQDPLVAAVPAAHPCAGGGPIDLAALAGMRLMLTPRRNHPALVDLVVGACAAAGFEPLPGPASGTLQDTLAAIGAASDLWTVVYASHARTLRAGRVAFVPFRDPALALPTSLLVPSGPPSPAVRALLAACRPPADASTGT